VIPGKKQYIKRLIGKPGDTLYFYGGEIYGINSSGRDLKELRDPKYFKDIEHIPFIRFDGKVETAENMTRGVYPTATVYQMNIPVAKLHTNHYGAVTGEMITDHKFRTFSDLWGFKNYAMSRILTAQQVKSLQPTGFTDLQPGLLYLELNHHPSLTGGKVARDDQGRFRPTLGTSTSILPLTQEHIDKIMAHMTTCRFEVKDSRVFRFGSGYEAATYRPQLPGIPNGMYEFQDGVGREVKFGGISQKLPEGHPLLAHTPAQVQILYNFGFEWSNHYAPSANSPFPSRYAYFRNGDLHLMSGSVMKKGDPFLTLFSKREYQKQSMSTSVNPYVPFDDAGAPIKETGELDVEFIKQNGITIPEKMYLVMGDNHAMSADSRQFGFVPQENLRGGASGIFWPAGDRWGRIPQAITNHMSLPNLTVLGLAFALSTLSYLYLQRKYFKPFKF
jgi:signal peptidase I